MTPHHSHHHATLCAAPHCRARGQHTTDCPGGDCRAYRDGWADGYLARHHETEETR